MNVIALFIILIFLLLLSAFFSGSETAMMSMNRYRLRHLVREKNRSAIRVADLLQHPDRLLGLILIGNTFANIFASAVGTMIAIQLFGEVGALIFIVVLTIVLLIFSEITPKTLAALYPERVAFPASIPLKFLASLFYPLIWLVNLISNQLLKLCRVTIKKQSLDLLSRDELRTIVDEATNKVSSGYHTMLLHVLDLDKATIEDIMIAKNDIVGIDISNDWNEIIRQLTQCNHTRIPIYRGTIDDVVGMLHVRQAMLLLVNQTMNRENFMHVLEEPYFIPETTPLNVQLANFQKLKRRIGLVVDEYGDLQGLATLEDILEEVIGEFTTDFAGDKSVVKSKDGSYLVEATITVRELNRSMNWHLPSRGPKTLSGLIIEQLEMIPSHPVCLKIDNYLVEVIKIQGNMVQIARIIPEE